MNLETERLKLRHWRDDDYASLAALNADVDVMEFMPKLLSLEESNSMADRLRLLIEQRGWGMWALERKADSVFMGFTGLHVPKDTIPFSPGVEIGWRLAKPFWGFGYATEAANEALRYAIEDLRLEMVYAYTSTINKRSQNVMRKIGLMNLNQNFHHPDVPLESPLNEQLVFGISRQDFLERQVV